MSVKRTSPPLPHAPRHPPKPYVFTETPTRAPVATPEMLTPETPSYTPPRAGTPRPSEGGVPFFYAPSTPMAPSRPYNPNVFEYTPTRVPASPRTPMVMGPPQPPGAPLKERTTFSDPVDPPLLDL